MDEKQTTLLWVREVARNPDRYPMVYSLLATGLIHSNPRLKQEDYRQQTKILFPLFAGGALAGAGLSAPLSLTRGPLTRRAFLSTAALGAGMIAAGRTADAASTAHVLGNASRSLASIRAGRNYRRLPQGFRQLLLPPIEAIEANPANAPKIRSILTPTGAARRAAEETARFTAAIGSAAIAVKAAQKGLQRSAKAAEKKNKRILPAINRLAQAKIGRRAFLGLSAGSMAAWLYVGRHNLGTGWGSNLPIQVDKELAALHRAMRRHPGR